MGSQVASGKAQRIMTHATYMGHYMPPTYSEPVQIKRLRCPPFGAISKGGGKEEERTAGEWNSWGVGNKP